MGGSSSDDCGPLRRRPVPRGAVSKRGVPDAADEGDANGADIVAAVAPAKRVDAGFDEDVIVDGDAAEAPEPQPPAAAQPETGSFAAARERGAAAQRTTRDREPEHRIDYAPDLCKDYRETGFCGFGDSCKFVHDRGAYAPSWRLEAEWERRRAGNAAPAARPEQHADTSGLCPVCGRPPAKPVRPKTCRHAMCEACALQTARTAKKCPVCATPMGASFAPVRG